MEGSSEARLPSSAVWHRDPQHILTSRFSLCQGTLDVTQSLDACVPSGLFFLKAQSQLHPSLFQDWVWVPVASAGPSSSSFSIWKWVAARLTCVQLRPCSKSNTLIKKAWLQDSAVFWQQAGREKMVMQLIITQICSSIADWSGPGKQTSLWHQFLS